MKMFPTLLFGGSAGGGGGGGVTSVSGTTDRITSTGGATPVIDIAATYVGQTSITTLGTVTTGTWGGSVIDEAFGGTGQSTYTAGDILYSPTTGANLSVIPVGAAPDGYALTLVSGVPAWAASGGTTPPGGNNTNVQFNDSGAFGGSDALIYDGFYLGLLGSQYIELDGSPDSSNNGLVALDVIETITFSETNTSTTNQAQRINVNNSGGLSKNNGSVVASATQTTYGLTISATSSGDTTATGSRSANKKLYGVNALSDMTGAIAGGGSNRENYALYGVATDSTFSGINFNVGVYGAASGGIEDWAGYFDGYTKVTADLTVDGNALCAGTFKATTYGIPSFWAMSETNVLGSDMEFFNIGLDDDDGPLKFWWRLEPGVTGTNLISFEDSLGNHLNLFGRSLLLDNAQGEIGYAPLWIGYQSNASESDTELMRWGSPSDTIEGQILWSNPDSGADALKFQKIDPADLSFISYIDIFAGDLYVGDVNGANINGTWTGSVIDANHGGTGISGYNAGDLLYASDENTLAKLGIGGEGQVLTMISDFPSWQVPSGIIAPFSLEYALATPNVTDEYCLNVQFDKSGTDTAGQLINQSLRVVYNDTGDVSRNVNPSMTDSAIGISVTATHSGDVIGGKAHKDVYGIRATATTNNSGDTDTAPNIYGGYFLGEDAGFGNATVYGIYAEATGGSNIAGYFAGDAEVQGVLYADGNIEASTNVNVQNDVTVGLNITATTGRIREDSGGSDVGAFWAGHAIDATTTDVNVLGWGFDASDDSQYMLNWSNPDSGDNTLYFNDKYGTSPSGYMAIQIGKLYVAEGGFFSNAYPWGPSTTPTLAQELVDKAYVDAFASGVVFKAACNLATAAALPTNTYSNGASGVGATLTATANGALTVDSVSVTSGMRILVKNEVAQANNGIYTVTATGDGSNPYVLTRATDYDQGTECNAGTTTFVVGGTVNAGGLFAQITLGTITMGTTALMFTLINQGAVAAYTASLGVQLVGSDFRANLSGTGAITLSGDAMQVNVDGSSIVRSGNQILVGAGGVTNAMLAGSIDLTTKVTGVLPLANGGTNKNMTPVAGAIVYTDSNSMEVMASAGTSGTLLQSTGGSAPAFTTATYPSTATGTGTILRANGTNIVASTATYPDTIGQYEVLYGTASNVIGALPNHVSGLLATTSSGSLQWLFPFANGELAIGQTGGGLVRTTLTQASADQVIITNGAGSITLSLPQSINTTSSPTFNALTLTTPLTVANGGTGSNGSGFGFNRLMISNGTSAIFTDADLTWATTNRLGILTGAAAEQATLHIRTSATASSAPSGTAFTGIRVGDVDGGAAQSGLFMSMDTTSGAGFLQGWNVTSAAARNLKLQAAGGLTQIGGSTSVGGWVAIGAATTTNANLVLDAGTAPTSPVSGATWHDSTQKAVTSFLAGVKQNFVGALFTQTNTVTLANSTAETSITGVSGFGTTSLPANFLAIGKTIKVKARGVYSTTGTPTLTFFLNFGGSHIAQTAAITTPSGVTNLGWYVEAEFTCRTTGSSGTIFTQGTAVLSTSTILANGVQMVNTGTNTVNTTAINSVVLSAQWNAANPNNTISTTNMTVEVLN